MKYASLLFIAMLAMALNTNAQSAQSLIGQWICSYEVDGENFSVKYQFKSESGQLKCYAVEMRDDQGNAEAFSTLAMKDISFKDGKGEATYIFNDEGEVYDTEADLILNSPTSLTVDYSYYGFGDTEHWKRMK